MPEFQQVDTEEHKGLAGDPGPFLEKCDHDMLGEQLIGIEAAGLLLSGGRKNTLYPLG
jgi:hypothetical protein